jgi:hypothetical protein
MKLTMNDLMTVVEVAEYHKKSRQSVYTAISRGKLKPFISKGYSPLFLRAEVEAMVWPGRGGNRKKPKVS